MRRATLGAYEAPASIVNPRTGLLDDRTAFGSRLRMSSCPDCRAVVMVHHFDESLLIDGPLRWRESWLPPRFVALDDGSFGLSPRGGNYRDTKFQKPERWPARVHCPSKACNRLTLEVDDPRLGADNSVQSE